MNNYNTNKIETKTNKTELNSIAEVDQGGKLLQTSPHFGCNTQEQRPNARGASEIAKPTRKCTKASSMNGCGSSSSSSCESSADECQMQSSGGSAASGRGRKSNAIVARPNASPGYWLCCLLPLAFAMRYIRAPPAACASAIPASYNMLVIAAMGMAIESLCFFMYMFLDTGLLLKLLISFVPGLMTTALYMQLLQQSWRFGLFWGFAVTFCYQNAYIRVMRGLPRCFTYGEAAVLVQGLMLFVLNAVLQLPEWLFFAPVEHGKFAQLNAIMISALACLLLVCWLLATFSWLRKPCGFYPLMVLLLATVTCIPVTEPLPIETLFQFILADTRRLSIIAFYLALVALTVATVWWQLRDTQKASTRVRKIFHLLIVLVFVPGLLYQCAFLYIATGVALAICTVIELFRVLEIPPLADVLKKAFASFSDEKDAGALALTPFCLLIGCSLPIWISPCPCSSSSANASNFALLPLLAGILSIGFGDTAASVIGSKIGRCKWRNSSRSVEGTIAFIVVVLLAVLGLQLAGFIPMSQYRWLVTVAATLITAFIEAHTDQIDNLVLPLVFYTIISFG